MRGTFVILKRDFFSLLESPFFFAICGLASVMFTIGYLQSVIQLEFQAMMGAQFGGGMANFHQRVVVPHISIANLLFILIVPILTMRLISEEKRNRTFDLLLTTPVSATNIALGKFLAGYAAALVLVLISAIYPLMTIPMVDVEIGPLVTAYLGLSLVTGVYVAIGVFCSALSESVVLSAVFAVVLNIALWLFSQWSSQMEGATWVAVIEQIALVQQFVTFIEGKIQINAIVFFLSAVVLFVFLSQRVVESARWR